MFTFPKVLKYSTITIINSIYSLGLFVFVGYGLFFGIRKFVRGEITDAVSDFHDARETDPIFNTLVLVVQFFMPLITSIAVTANFLISKDALEGR